MLIVCSSNSEWTTVEGKSVMALICSTANVLFDSEFQLDLIWPSYFNPITISLPFRRHLCSSDSSVPRPPPLPAGSSGSHHLHHFWWSDRRLYANTNSQSFTAQARSALWTGTGIVWTAGSSMLTGGHTRGGHSYRLKKDKCQKREAEERILQEHTRHTDPFHRPRP